MTPYKPTTTTIISVTTIGLLVGILGNNINVKWLALVSILSCAELILLQAYLHYQKIEVKHQSPSHWKAWGLRLLVALAFSSAVHAFHFNIWKVIFQAGFGMSALGIVFMISLNDYRDRDYLYLGQTAYWDKKFNKWFGRFAGLAYALVLLVLAVGFVIGYL